MLTKISKLKNYRKYSLQNSGEIGAKEIGLITGSILGMLCGGVWSMRFVDKSGRKKISLPEFISINISSIIIGSAAGGFTGSLLATIHPIAVPTFIIMICAANIVYHKIKWDSMDSNNE